MSISLPPKGDSAKRLGSYFTPLKVEAQSTPNMTVRVSEGAFWTSDNQHVEYIGGTSPLISAPASDAKWVLITLTSNGMINVVDGVASGNPDLPPPSAYKNELPLAAIFVGDTTTAITNDMIFDVRPLWQIQPDSVSQDQLSDFATKTYVDNGLALKADLDGTSSPNFTLNVGGSSINDSGIYAERNSGPTVGIRFNETATAGSPPTVTPMWEFTNDGVTWNPIGVSSGSYFTKADLLGGALDGRYFTQNDLLVTGVLDSIYYKRDFINNNFALIGHTHDPSDIIGLADPVLKVNNKAPVAGNVELYLNDLLDVTSASPSDSQVIVYRTGWNEYRNDQLRLNDLEDVNTSSSAPVAGEALIFSGSQFVNRPLIKSDISDFSGTEFVLVTNVNGDPYDPLDPSTWVDQDIWGTKTFKNGIVVEESLVVTGSNTSIETTELRVKDAHIDLNYLNPITNPSAFTSGIRVDRSNIAGSPSSEPAAIIQWDENAGQWEFGVVGNTQPMLGGAHTHTVSQISDFPSGVKSELNNNNNLNEIRDVNYLSSPATGEYLRYGVSAWENRNFAADFTSELNANVLNELQDVSYLGSPTLTAGDFLQWNGTMWVNRTATKSDISDFVESDYIHTTGNETKTGNLNIVGEFVVDGNFITTDAVIVLNDGEPGTGVGGGTGTAGIELDRGPTAEPARLLWVEPAGKWYASYSAYAGSPPSPTLLSGALSFEGHQHVVSDITDLSVTANEINTLNAINTSTTVQAQLDDKISRTGDVMDPTANLTFTFGGEVLGLPAVPSVDDAATSKLYVDTQLSNHIADYTLHLTAAQNTFLDGLVLSGSPALTSADVNQLIGITGNVQALLDTKTDKLTPAVDRNLAALDIATGNIVDSGVVVNDAGTTVNEIWTANKIDTTKADKVVPALVGNLAGLDAAGNLTDSGLILNDSGNLVSEIWSANKIDTTKADKVSAAIAGNFAGLDATGNLTDSGFNSGSFAPASHTHTTSEITDWSSAFTSELGVNNLSAIGDVSNNTPAVGDLLQWNGTIWDNVQPSAMSSFVRATGGVNESIDGQKTFANNAFFQQNVSVTGNVTVSGGARVSGDLIVDGDRIVNGKEIVTTNNITLNYGTTDPITADKGGIILQRDTTGPGSPVTPLAVDAVILWDEYSQRWVAGVYDNTGAGTGTDVENVALENKTVSQPYYDLQTASGGAVYTLPFGVPMPVAGKTGIQVFVNGIKQVEGATKSYTVDYSNPAQTVVTFNAGAEPALGDDVEFYGFGYIG